MNRRGFLLGILAIGGAGLVPTNTDAQDGRGQPNPCGPGEGRRGGGDGGRRGEGGGRRGEGGGRRGEGGGRGPREGGRGPRQGGRGPREGGPRRGGPPPCP